MDSRKTAYVLGVILFLLVGIIAGLGYKQNKLDPIGITPNLLGTKEYKVAGSITGPENKPILRPLALEVYEDKLLIADSGNSRILVYNDKGKFLRTIGDTGTSSERLLFPTDIALNQEGIVYVADRQGGRIIGYDQQGKVKFNFPQGEDRTTLGGFSPLSIAVGNNQIYAFDVEAQRLVTFSLEGDFQEVIEVKGVDLAFVNGLSYSKKSDTLYISNSNLGTVLKLEMKSRNISTLDNLPEAQVFLPRGNTLDKTEENLFIVDLFKHKILKYSLSEEKIIDRIGDEAQGTFSYPNDISSNEEGWLFIADRANNRIVVLEPIVP